MCSSFYLNGVIRIIHPILNRDHDEQQQPGATKKRLEIADCVEFENTL
jgi:hypothetical protein